MSKIQLISPADGSLYCERIYADDKEIDQILVASKLVQPEWKSTSLDDRIVSCRKALAYFSDHKADIAEEITWQMGRPIRYVEGEVEGLIERAEVMLALASEQLAPYGFGDQPGIERYIQRDPLGTVFVIAPWNYPYLTAVNTIIPALVAGNTVILKHSVQTLLCAERFQKAFDFAGLPHGVFQYVHANHQSASAIVADTRVGFVAFTGSVEGGRSVEQTAAGLFKGIGLELGGKDPAYVLSDANIESSVEGIVDGAFFNSGQSCCGIERVYVHERNFDEFVERAVALASEYKLGFPQDSETTLGPLVNAKAADWVRQQIAEAVSMGAKSCIDSKTFSLHQDQGAYLAPQILVNVNHTMSLMKEESFGPVVGIMSVKNDDEAITLMNDSDFGLTASLWTADLKIAQKLGDVIQTGTVFMNRCDYLDPYLPWVGVKQSGRGCTLSHIGYEQLTRPKSFHMRLL
ncbi:aldehyde dehydrogenase [Gammaproteobacteria bacterium 42_54_T18]|nr:aldehyde dehydrogenase [Gammaproteobacteria bacterium 42_54_T18]